ncbi:PTS lactose/cellobiose transporter subunit IIA, partial [Bacillus cereus]
AHNSQTQILAAEAGGESVELGFIMVHAQDHLMTTLLLSDIVEHLIEIYTKG